MDKFYITFGSDEQFPYPNGYMIIEAENERKAREIFGENYPSRDGSDCLNFSFCYSEEEWQRSVSKYYQGKEPSAYLTQEVLDTIDIPKENTNKDKIKENNIKE